MSNDLSAYLADENELLKLCIYREARNQSDMAMLGIKWVLKNRCSLAPREGFKKTISENILKKYAFSSFLDSDPNSKVFPPENDPVWARLSAIVEGDSPDPTAGSVFYFSPPLKSPPKAWGNVVFAAKWDDLHFYKLP